MSSLCIHMYFQVGGVNFLDAHSWICLEGFFVFFYAWQAEEAKENYKACVADVELKRSDMETVKSEILTQIRELVYQCDLTLKAVC